MKPHFELGHFAGPAAQAYPSHKATIEDTPLPDHEFVIKERIYKTGKKAGQTHMSATLIIFPCYEFKRRTERANFTFFTCNGCERLGQFNCAKARKIENTYQLVSWPVQHACSPPPPASLKT